MFRCLLDTLYHWREVINTWHILPRTITQLVLVVGMTILSYLACRYLMSKIKEKCLESADPKTIYGVILTSRLLTRILLAIPLIVAGIFTHTILNDSIARTILIVANNIFFIFVCAFIFSAILRLTYRLINLRNGVEESPQKGIFQVLTIFGYVFATVAGIATLSGRDPMVILSGMTALSAVLMLVFKDSIMGLTAGVTLASNGMVRMGDWIEVPGADADGNVIDMTLTSIRVRNWDNTVTAVPAYNLIGSPFKNWNNMVESGGRRIKRAIQIDLDSICFANEEMIERWKNIDLIRDYLAEKIKEIRAYNDEHPSSTLSLVNSRRLTNIGTFRAYCLAYLKKHKDINHSMSTLVRQLDPTDHGLPLEIYCFTSNTGFEEHEAIQSNIFDHFLSIMPEFGLSNFQHVSATAMRNR